MQYCGNSCLLRGSWSWAAVNRWWIYSIIVWPLWRAQQRLPRVNRLWFFVLLISNWFRNRLFYFNVSLFGIPQGDYQHLVVAQVAQREARHRSTASTAATTASAAAFTI